LAAVGHATRDVTAIAVTMRFMFDIASGVELGSIMAIEI
jgi:hypothetical protein